MTIRRRLLLGVAAIQLLAVPGFLAAGPAIEPDSGDEATLERLHIFNDVLRFVRANYVDEVDPPLLVDGAIAGLLKKLDPHSNYLDPKRFQQTSERNRGEYDGIGISFVLRDSAITVLSTIEGTPAERLGIRPGDQIVEIDAESALGIGEDEVFARLRGPEGSSVHLGIRREGAPDLLAFELVRARIPIKSVPYWFMLDPDTGYIRLVRFSATTDQEFETALLDLETAGMRRLLLDMRGNPGGYLEQAVAVADKFIDSNQLIVYTRGRIRGVNEEHRATDEDSHPQIPLIVLIDHESASAAEIVAGALQDWDRALVVGQTSFGKGLVQRQYRLRDGSALFLTVGRYYTPSGRLIQRDYAMDRVSYYAAGYDDEDEGPAAADSTAARLAFHTAAGRQVQGGGGIVPDVRIDSPEVNDRQQALERANVAFTFANHYIVRTGYSYPRGFERFLSEYRMDDSCWQAFLAHAAATDLELTREDLAAERAAIAASVKQEMAGHLWGPTARYRVLIANDPVVNRSREFFPEAAELLALEALANGRPGRDPALPNDSVPGENN